MQKLQAKLPEGSIPLILESTEAYDLEIRISRSRKSKLGDFRPKHKELPHRISVNTDLGKEAFLITLLHEIAHMHIWETFQRRVKPHGNEWKQAFIKLLQVATERNLFSIEVSIELLRILKNPTTSILSNANLCLALGIWQNEFSSLCDIPSGSAFSLENKRKFVKGDLRRTRYACRSLSDGKLYLIHKLTPVILEDEHE
ncbi:MAG: SprT-like domain-containing protein [Flavobacteriales bacterium]|nr:SprT-like domain-containing protein [Flavobacteriales bacterium]